MSDLLTNVFASDAFTTVALTAAVNKIPYVPGQAGKTGIFDESGINTTSLAVESVDGTVKLIPNTPRGAPARTIATNRRKLIPITVPHFPTTAGINADQIQGVRAFGSASQLQTIEQVRNQAMANHTGSLDATVEYGRIGAIKGVIYDADGSTEILNLFTAFGLTQDTTDFALNSSSTVVRTKCTAVLRKLDAALGAASYTQVVAFCGDTFFDSLIDHANVTAAFTNWANAQQLTLDQRVRGFTYGDITFINYRGSVTGSGGSAVDFIPAKKAYAFPIGVPGLFKTNFAPADYMEAVNTIGLPRYAKAEPRKYNKGVDIEMQTNAISYCVRPQVLQEMTTP